MSVIFGIDEQEQIVICADKRASDVNGTFLSDAMDKVCVINEHLAFASAGNDAIEKAIQIDLNALKNANELTVEGLLSIIQTFYNKVIAAQATSILMLPFCCLIAGSGNDGKGMLLNLCCMKGKLSFQKAPMALWPPKGSSSEECNNIFARNYKRHHDEFCERTVREIAAISDVVSLSGDKWVFNKSTGIGELSSF